MGIHVNIAEAKARLSELVAASLRGETVTLQRAGKPLARIVALPEAEAEERRKIGERRRAAFGMYKDRVGDREIDVKALKLTDEEQEAEYRRKFGAAD
jgi:prevent-host-death family protein